MGALKIIEISDIGVRAGFYRHKFGQFFLIKRATIFGEVLIDNGMHERYVSRKIMENLRLVASVEYFCENCGQIFESGEPVTFCPTCKKYSTKILNEGHADDVL